jgi:glucose/arabinose dehydrogenase
VGALNSHARARESSGGYARGMRRIAGLIAAASCACSGGGEAPPKPRCEGVVLVDAFAGRRFAQPLLLTQAPGEPERFFVVEKRGAIQSVVGASVTTFLDIAARVNSSPAEAGMLGLAFHPEWATNHQAFVSYTAPSAQSPANLRSTLSRFTSNDGGATLDPATEQPMLTIEQPFANHNGGHVLIGPDRLLYFGLGDGGSAGDPFGNAQNLSVILGKLLRLDPGTGSAAPENPFVGSGDARIYAYGLRNPWRFSFDRQTAQLWLADVGQNLYEEVDLIVAGGNYGWPIREGLHCYQAATCASGFIDPVVEYGRELGYSITGGFVYRGRAVPQLAGRYVYGDYGSGRVWAVAAAGPYQPAQIAQAESVSSFGEDAQGELYVVELLGSVLKIASACP